MKQKERAYCHNTRENGLLFHLKEGKKTDKISKIAKSMSQSQIAIAFRIIALHIEYRKMSKNIALVVSGGRVQVVVSAPAMLTQAFTPGEMVVIPREQTRESVPVV